MVSLREEHTVPEFENKMFIYIFVPKRDQVNEQYGIPHNEELHINC